MSGAIERFGTQHYLPAIVYNDILDNVKGDETIIVKSSSKTFYDKPMSPRPNTIMAISKSKNIRSILQNLIESMNALTHWELEDGGVVSIISNGMAHSMFQGLLTTVEHPGHIHENKFRTRGDKKQFPIFDSEQISHQASVITFVTQDKFVVSMLVSCINSTARRELSARILHEEPYIGQDVMFDGFSDMEI